MSCKVAFRRFCFAAQPEAESQSEADEGEKDRDGQN